MASDAEQGEGEEESASELLRDRFRLCTISIAEAEVWNSVSSEAEQHGSLSIMSCISDLAFKYAQQLAKDLELFAQHGGRKSVNMEDVILSAHRNDHMAASLRLFCNELKTKEPQSERKRRRSQKEKKYKRCASHS